MLKFTQKKGVEIFSLKSSFEKFKIENLEVLLKYHFVFDRFESFCVDEIFADIMTKIIKNYDQFFTNLTLDQKIALAKFAKSRKEFSINSVLPHFKARKIFFELLDLGLLKLEISNEKQPLHTKYEKLPKILRRYKIQNKVKFCDNFTRFYFYFIFPNYELLAEKKFEIVLEKIRQNFDTFCGFCFENLCQDFLSLYLNIENFKISSFWDKNCEIDIYALNGEILGEAKFSQRKICVNVLNNLQKKAKILGINPQKFAIFSKSGFSKKLINLAKFDEKILLFELKNFEILL